MTFSLQENPPLNETRIDLSPESATAAAEIRNIPRSWERSHTTDPRLRWMGNPAAGEYDQDRSARSQSLAPLQLPRPQPSHRRKRVRTKPRLPPGKLL